MRYKILMAGKNNTVIDDIFAHLSDDMDLLTTSTRVDDIMTHVKYCQPDLFCYCINDEPVDTIRRIVALKRRLGDSLPLFVVGSHENCMDFAQEAPNAADVILTTPMKAVDIGSRFSSYLGRNQRQAGATPAQEEDAFSAFMPRSEEMNLGVTEPVKKKSILVVDDNVTMLKTINRILHDKYEVATAANGKVAFKFLEKKRVDLILLDYEMPEESGAQVLEKLRQNPVTKDIPVIFLTGVTERAKIAQALVLQPQGYLLKPVEHDKLLASIKKILGG